MLGFPSGQDSQSIEEFAYRVLEKTNVKRHNAASMSRGDNYKEQKTTLVINFRDIGTKKKVNIWLTKNKGVTYMTWPSLVTLGASTTSKGHGPRRTPPKKWQSCSAASGTASSGTWARKHFTTRTQEHTKTNDFKLSDQRARPGRSSSSFLMSNKRMHESRSTFQKSSKVSATVITTI